MPEGREEVPCGTCHRCCVGELVVLHPEHGDIVSAYVTRPVIDPLSGRPAHALVQRADGSCHYLDEETGCTIHGRAPRMCAIFSCIRFYLDSLRAERHRRAKLAPGAAAIYARAKELIEGGA